MTNPPDLIWSKPEHFPSLSDGEVHVWRAGLEEDESQVEKYLALLSADEKARAARLVFANHRARFITARGILRSLLGQYSHTPPQALTFAYSEHGKPALSTSQLPNFNLSHSENQAVYVFGLDGRLGIDIEMHDLQTEKQTIANRFFSPNEAAALARVSESQGEMTRAFYCCWTRKEAFIKALGAGLSCPLDAFEVTFLAGEPPALLRLDLPGEMRENWQLFDISPLDRFSAAVATDVAVTKLRTFEWNDTSISY